jgi:hypothetical protein
VSAEVGNHFGSSARSVGNIVTACKSSGKDIGLIPVSLLRKPFGGRPLTLATSSELYSYEADAVISGVGHLELLGWPRSCAPLGVFTERDLRVLAGESFSLTISCCSGSVCRRTWWVLCWVCGEYVCARVGAYVFGLNMFLNICDSHLAWGSCLKFVDMLQVLGGRFSNSGHVCVCLM